MNVMIYDKLPEEAQKIRETVFMKEQGFCEEFDEVDEYARHLVLYDGTIPIATCRFFRKESCGDYTVGRIAVVKAYRGKKIGAFLLKEVETVIRNSGGKGIRLQAQYSAREFYRKQGYDAYGEIDLDENCPHIWMRKDVVEG